MMVRKKHGQKCMDVCLIMMNLKECGVEILMFHKMIAGVRTLEGERTWNRKA